MGTEKSHHAGIVERSRRAAGLVGLALGLVALPPGASAQSGSAVAAVLPAVVNPGHAVQLIFSANAPALASVDLLPHIRCTVTDPVGVVVDACSRSEGLVRIGLLGEGERDYVFSYVAPARLGTYRVHFETSNVLGDAGGLLGGGLLGGLLGTATSLVAPAMQADTTFRVVAPATTNGGAGGGGGTNGGGATGGGGSGDNPDPPANDGADDDPGTPAGADATSRDRDRFFLSVGMGAASLVVILLSRRFGAGVVP